MLILTRCYDKSLSPASGRTCVFARTRSPLAVVQTGVQTLVWQSSKRRQITDARAPVINLFVFSVIWTIPFEGHKILTSANVSLRETFADVEGFQIKSWPSVKTYIDATRLESKIYLGRQRGWSPRFILDVTASGKVL